MLTSFEGQLYLALILGKWEKWIFPLPNQFGKQNIRKHGVHGGKYLQSPWGWKFGGTVALLCATTSPCYGSGQNVASLRWWVLRTSSLWLHLKITLKNVSFYFHKIISFKRLKLLMVSSGKCVVFFRGVGCGSGKWEQGKGEVDFYFYIILYY